MADAVKIAFHPDGIMVAITKILPLKQVSGDTKHSRLYVRIAASVREVGLIEPLVIYPKGGKNGQYSLLDGHIRLEILKDMGQTEVFCLVATEDEAYTYNHKVSVVSPIQEHFMILKAIENGVSEERLAKALAVDVSSIRQKRDLLNGICPEAVEVLKDKQAPSRDGLRLLRRVKPMRQIEMAQLMAAASNYSAAYAKLLLAATPADQLVEGELPAEVRQIKPEDLARMERELNSLGRDLKMREETYGKNMLHLVMVTAYLRKLLGNTAVAKHLSNHHCELASQIRQIIESTTLSNPI